MNALIAAAFARARTTVLLFFLLLFAGIFAYAAIPKESTPTIEIPFFSVSVTYPGISAEDSARLLIEPLERRLQAISGLRRLTGQAGDGFANLRLEFEPGHDQATALTDVRDEVDRAVPDLPVGANAPVVSEIDLSLFPILTVGLSGPIPERDLIRLGRDLAQRIESVPGVLEAQLSGDREDLLEVNADPLAMQSYGISAPDLARAVQSNNQLVPAGSFDTGAGRIGASIPGMVRSLADVLVMPVVVTPDTVVRIQDVAEVRQTFRDPTSFARIGGEPTVAIDITRSTNANILETVAAVQAVLAEEKAHMPLALQIHVMQNQAEDIASMLGDLENGVILAVIMVMLPTILILGLKPSLMIGISIPSAFFGGILVIYLMGFTLNIIVLFGLILVIGMLVDGTMVVVEKAERLQSQGMSGPDAYREAASRMAWPVIAAIATSLAVFFPLLFWPGTAGRFMMFLPATVLVTLIMSLVVALVFVPVIGGLIAGKGRGKGSATASAQAEISVPAFYDTILSRTLRHPLRTVVLTVAVLVASFLAYGRLGPGVEFFPAIEAERAQIQIRADGNLSVFEADRLVRLVERAVAGTEGIELSYARTIGTVEGRLAANVDPDVIGTIQLDLVDWRSRRPAREILNELEAKAASVPGVGVQIQEQRTGPVSSRPVELELSSDDLAALPAAASIVTHLMEELGGFTDISSDVPVPGVEARLVIDRARAAHYGADVATLGNAVRLMTNGVILGSYLPPDVDDEVDIVLRYPLQDRNFTELSALRVLTPMGMIPVSNFATIVPSEAPAIVKYSGGRIVQNISAGLAPGRGLAEELQRLQERLDGVGLGAVDWRFRGEIEDQQDTLRFLVVAFVAALFLMFMVMLTQLNSFLQSFLVLSAIVCSIPGVLIMLIVTQAPFSMVMGGMGVMALAGVVLNNNIILIDAYNELRAQGLDPDSAALRAARERLRPILLTAFTTITGLIPMAIGLTVDFFDRDAYFGAPSGQFWVQLSTTIVGGLIVGTIITSCLTPTLLAWDGRRREAAARRSRQGGDQG
ncbi:efflux RND transporter permease subunit [Paracoccus sp. KR1-242]|uniref:efflux RND transporter permease subunit n=1 Tax=Paracoccus sp. KR1-242 TaxID=3410028 RepID=UPI003BFE4C69